MGCSVRPSKSSNLPSGRCGIEISDMYVCAIGNCVLNDDERKQKAKKKKHSRVNARPRVRQAHRKGKLGPATQVLPKDPGKRRAAPKYDHIRRSSRGVMAQAIP